MTRTVAISVASTVVVVALTMALTARCNGAGTPTATSESRVSVGDVLTGDDLGVRILDVQDDQVIGEFVVRIEGEWLQFKKPAPPPVLPARP
jgi:hypothetical protein